MRLRSALLGLALAALPPAFARPQEGAPEVRAYEREVAGAPASVQVALADAQASEAAAERAFEALTAAEGSAGAACDRALAALSDAGAGAALVRWRGTLAAGEPPPGAPGWLVPVGFGTPGYPVLHLPLARSGLALVAPGGGPLRIGVLSRDGAAEAERLALEAHGLGRRAGRARIARAEGARIFVEDARFRPLFDGRTLSGFTTVGGRYDGAARWSAERGAIVGRPGPGGEGGLLYTDEVFTSFVVEMEVQLEAPCDSGVFLRMTPDARGAQVTLDDREGGEIGAIYSDGFLAHQPDGRAHWRAGAYNHVEVRVTGFDMRVEAWLNGEPLADHRLPPGAPGFARAGRIGLQVHPVSPEEAALGHAARFRNLRVRPLPVFGEAPPSAEEGFQDPFEHGLDGWERHGDAGGWAVEDGVLLVPARGAGHLASVEDFEDLELALEFRLERMANGGVFLRAARDGSNPAFSGCEIQLLDDQSWEEVTGQTLAPWQHTGSLYGAVPAGDVDLRPPGEWNALELSYVGSRLAVALNGRLCYDVDVLALEPASGPPFAERAPRGFLGLQAHAPDEVEGDVALWIRGARVRRL